MTQQHMSWYTGLSGIMSALLALHRAAICRKHGRTLLLTLSRQNSRLLANRRLSVDNLRDVLSRLGNGRQLPLSNQSERTLTSQPPNLIQVGLLTSQVLSWLVLHGQLIVRRWNINVRPNYSNCLFFNSVTTDILSMLCHCVLIRVFFKDHWVREWWESPKS